MCENLCVFTRTNSPSLYSMLANKLKPKQWAWDHFWTDRNNYKGDKSHKNAWCHVELELEVEVMHGNDSDAVACGDASEACSKEALWVEGMQFRNITCLLQCF
jgi:hypothetical protein